jgi:uncharacterized protein
MLVADLHLEKASWFAVGGQLLPPHDSLDTLTRLAGLIARFSPRELYCLGDNFHDAAGAARLEPQAAALLGKVARQVKWHWLIGNHDQAKPTQPMIAPPVGILADALVLDGLVLRHAAENSEQQPELSGHYHPVIRVAGRGRRIARRCFVAGSNRLILPAFGALTGGLDAAHPDIMRLAGPDAQALVPVAGRLLRFGLTAPITAS